MEWVKRSFVKYFNINAINLHFTAVFGDNKLRFLDVLIEDTHIKTSEYRKNTATNSLLHSDSCHPPYDVKKAVPFRQFTRLRRIQSEYDVPYFYYRRRN